MSVGHKPFSDLCPPMKIDMKGQKPPTPKMYQGGHMPPSPTNVKLIPHEKEVETQLNILPCQIIDW